MNETQSFKLVQDLEAALAAFQRHHGRPATVLRLRHMLDRAQAAQRTMDEAIASQGGERKAAE